MSAPIRRSAIPANAALLDLFVITLSKKLSFFTSNAGQHVNLLHNTVLFAVATTTNLNYADPGYPLLGLLRLQNIDSDVTPFSGRSLFPRRNTCQEGI